MIRAVLFDLDDTLYPEASFVRSGFAAVAAELERRGVAVAGGVASLLESIHFGEGRDGVFDKAAARLAFDRAWIPSLVALHRDHAPQGLELWPDARAALASLRGRYRLGCVTDGWAAVQRRKLEALGLAGRVEAIVLCDELGGRACWKPDPRAFRECCRRLAVEPAEAAFVGDNPERDLVGARRAGLVPIRIRRPGTYFHDVAEAEPGHELRDLAGLPALLSRLR